jgi:hypothetical protein
MPIGSVSRAAGRAADRVPGVKHVPVLKLLIAAEIAMMAHDHLTKLSPNERRRLMELVRIGHGRRRNLSDEQREELAELISRMEPRLLVGRALNKVSPVNLPRRVVYGPRQTRRNAKGQRRRNDT